MALSNDDLDTIVGLERRIDLIQMRNALRAEDIGGRVLEGNAPVGRRASMELGLTVCFARRTGRALRKDPAFDFAALDRQESSLNITGVSLVKCEFTGFEDCFIEDDGRTWQSIIEFSLITM